MIPFNRPYMTGKELTYIAEAHRNMMLAGDGPFTKRCHAWLEESTGTCKALLTHSCTAALEIAALLLDMEQGDEIIMPSFTFVSTANAFALRGAVPVFVDIRPDTQNINETLIEPAITARTKAIVPVHYAGVSCEMDTIMEIAEQHSLLVVEDAAQAVLSTYKGHALGSIGDLGTYSFHETKNVMCGEGGALLVNQENMAYRAEVIREKGTDRTRYFRGEVDKYTWQDIGSSYLPGELVAAFLSAQLEQAQQITDTRLKAWNRYDVALKGLEMRGLLRRPVIPLGCEHNGHMYYVILESSIDRNAVLRKLVDLGVGSVFHYVPLHSAPYGRANGRPHGDLAVTESTAASLIRLPLWVGIEPEQQDRVVEALESTVCS